jgi:hypothetical protein
MELDFRGEGMKKGMCKGCDNLGMKDQKKFFDESGRYRLVVPTVEKKPFCREHGLHLEYMERIYEGDRECHHYYSGGIS